MKILQFFSFIKFCYDLSVTIWKAGTRIPLSIPSSCVGGMFDWGAHNRTLAQANRVHKNTVAFGRKLLREIWCLKIDLYVIKANLSVLFQVIVS